MSLYETKYYPDKFYIKFDEEKFDNLLTIDDCGQFGLELSVFIHEYYHYLTNITTFQGIRSFNAIFQDKIRIITIIQKKCGGLDGFPLFSNNREDCQPLIKYWKDVDDIITGDSALQRIALEINNSPAKRVQISNISYEYMPLSVEINGELIEGEHEMVFLDVDGITNNHFMLPIAAVDEFLSASIDEYLFQTDTTDNIRLLQGRPYYPYLFFDEILNFMGRSQIDAKLKIIIAYKALHGNNPTVNLIEILKKISNDEDKFVNDPFTFLETHFNWIAHDHFEQSLKYAYSFINECHNHGRLNLANVYSIIYNKAQLARQKLESDPYYFIRPLINSDLKIKEGRENYLNFLKTLLTEFNSFLQLKDHKLVDAFCNPEKTPLAFMLAAYEILKGAEKYKFIERTVTEYDLDLDDSVGFDKLENLPTKTPLTAIWHIALNDLSFYALYLDYRNKRKTTID